MRAKEQESVRRAVALFTLADQIEARFHAAQTQAAKLTPSVLNSTFNGEFQTLSNIRSRWCGMVSK